MKKEDDPTWQKKFRAYRKALEEQMESEESARIKEPLKAGENPPPDDPNKLYESEKKRKLTKRLKQVLNQYEEVIGYMLTP